MRAYINVRVCMTACVYIYPVWMCTVCVSASIVSVFVGVRTIQLLHFNKPESSHHNSWIINLPCKTKSLLR